MNIIVRTFSGNIVFRPDTSRKREEDDLYLPDFVSTLSYTPIVYIRMDRPGKCIAERFAKRYYSKGSFGLLLYPENLIDGSEEGFASAICMDKCSCLKLNPDQIKDSAKNFSLFCNGNLIFEQRDFDSSSIDSAVEQASQHCFLRTGDTLCVELAPRKILCSQEDKSCLVEGIEGGNSEFSFKVYF